MLISEVLGSEVQGAGADKEIAAKDLLSLYMGDGESGDISTPEFKAELEANLGMPINVDELVALVNATGFASSVDANTIRAADDLSGDVDTEVDTVDIGKMAGNQAMKDIKAGL